MPLFNRIFARLRYLSGSEWPAPRQHRVSTTSAPRQHHVSTTPAPRQYHVSVSTMSANGQHHVSTTPAPRQRVASKMQGNQAAASSPNRARVAPAPAPREWPVCGWQSGCSTVGTYTAAVQAQAGRHASTHAGLRDSQPPQLPVEEYGWHHHERVKHACDLGGALRAEEVESMPHMHTRTRVRMRVRHGRGGNMR